MTTNILIIHGNIFLLYETMYNNTYLLLLYKMIYDNNIYLLLYNTI